MFSSVSHRKHAAFQLECFEFLWKSSSFDKSGHQLSPSAVG